MEGRGQDSGDGGGESGNGSESGGGDSEGGGGSENSGSESGGGDNKGGGCNNKGDGSGREDQQCWTSLIFLRGWESPDWLENPGRLHTSPQHCRCQWLEGHRYPPSCFEGWVWVGSRKIHRKSNSMCCSSCYTLVGLLISSFPLKSFEIVQTSAPHSLKKAGVCDVVACLVPDIQPFIEVKMINKWDKWTNYHWKKKRLSLPRNISRWKRAGANVGLG